MSEGGRIVRLRPEVIAKIAAGEMILRPLSVAKELLENALDAGSTRIEITVQESADHFLMCADDGCGMTSDEALLAVESHTTSKLSEETDLLAVATLGFRGEALASIARVAQMRIVTAPEGGEGTELRIRGGVIDVRRPAARARGTTVEVEDLFFNSPVRKRFLRSPIGEVRLIQKLIAAYGLVRPDIDFKLVFDGKESMHIGTTDAEGRLEQVYGTRFREKVLSLSGEHPRIRVRGWVGIPEIARSGSAAQTIIVNGRWVTHPGIGHALRQGFGDLIPAGRQPFAVLILDLASGTVDVNVHPTKREIRFVDEGAVYAETLRVVRAATSRLVPGIGSLTEGGRWGAIGSTVSPPLDQRVEATAGRFALPFTPFGSGPRTAEGLGLLYRPTRPPEAVVADRSTTGVDESTVPREIPMVPLWQLQDRYIIAQTKQGILIVDQHAAHERILYERALSWLAGGRATSQELLFPELVELEPGESALLQSLAEDLPRLGIHLEPFGERSVLVRAVPATWEGKPETLLRDLLDEVAERTSRREERTQALAASFACHSAIRSGAKLDLESMNRLIDELFATNLPHGDPHGRPTYVVLSIDDLDRRFGRS
jgi:DNA mismatch repair protein MutL